MGTSSPKRSVLISGASIAGPALAHQLHAHGFEVTVVERASAVRGGGYPIDVRGTAVEVVERMGLLPRLRAAHIDTRHITFLDAGGSVIASVTPEAITGGAAGRDVELPRGELAAALHDAVRDDVEFLFGDSIATLRDDGEHVDVTFRSGLERTFDLVVGADGLHSGTRELIFGPEEPFHRYLDRCFAGFTMPNHLGLSHGGLVLNTPGRAAVLYAPGDSDVLHAFLTFVRSEPPFDAFADPGAQRDLVASVFADGGWEVPRMVEAMRAAPDLFFDVVSQIHLPRWSSGRVALVGDAAHAPSFLSGQGSSIALVGAYVLAGELASTSDHRAAFTAYEARVRPFVERNQALAHAGGARLVPRTAEELALRDEALRAASAAPSGDEEQDVHSSLDLPDHVLPC
ncbi:FAD-dependent monooxygenase [Umezawaea beigongshangensis]|uniref:FAD-dependent monooxygenase n=1 Tax=Umezawaea beigongshangensis TaxID=2780383 RepID=UPI0018F23DA5|nr:FAD-dependent monooxygenase [Umezawaea beigongshangensis]